MSGAWIGPYLVACGLLAVAGAAKALRPDATARALRAAGLRVPTTAVRAGGGVEAVLGAAAAGTGAPLLAALVAASYVAFAGFIVLALWRGTPISSCGCFGKADTPPSPLHVALDVAAAATAAIVAQRAAHSLPRALAHQALGGAPLLVLVAVTGYLAYLAFAFPLGRKR